MFVVLELKLCQDVCVQNSGQEVWRPQRVRVNLEKYCLSNDWFDGSVFTKLTEATTVYGRNNSVN